MIMYKIGIMGGTFNPIHNGHLMIARKALLEYKLDKIIFLPNGTPPHKSSHQMASGEHRLAMVQSAIKNEPDFVCSDYEIKKGGVSYTADTLSELKNIYKDAELYFIIGADSLRDFPKWVRPEEISGLCTLIVYPRDGIDLIRCKEFAEKTFNTRILLIDGEDYSISSSQLRLKIQTGEPVWEHIPEGVMDIINKNSLYKK